MTTTDDLKKVQDFIYSKEVHDDLEKINNHLMDINVLEISGIGNQEIKHSNVLAWMFGDNQHQLDWQILEKFLGQASDRGGINAEKENLKNLRHYAYFPEKKREITIKREWKNIDLLIEDKANKVVIVIENKVWAEESESQLKKYQTTINEEYSETKNNEEWKRHYIFLTPDGSDVKDEENKINWLNVDYQAIYNIVKDILEKSGEDIPHEAKIVLESYNDLLIKEGIVENKELEILCAKIWNEPRYRDALELLISNKPSNIKNISNVIKEKLEKELEVNYLSEQRKGNTFWFNTPLIREKGHKEIYFGLDFTNSGIWVYFTAKNDDIAGKLQEAKVFKRNCKSTQKTFNNGSWKEWINNTVKYNESNLAQEIKSDLKKAVESIKKWDEELKNVTA